MTADAPQEPAFLEDYLDTLRAVRRLAENTVRSYRRDLALFAAFIGTLAGKESRDVDHEDIQAYLRWLSERGLSGRSRARNLSALRSLRISIARAMS